jgi:predicted dinucleotide-binding enzyme
VIGKKAIPMTDLTGKTAVISGSARGIGKAIALRYAGLGANIVVNYASSKKEADATVAEIEASARRRSRCRRTWGLLHRWRARSGQAEMMRPRPARVSAPRSSFAGFRFPQDVIMIAVRWYLRYGLSYRDVEELLAERGIVVDHVTVYRWVQRFTPLLIDAARRCRHTPVLRNAWAEPSPSRRRHIAHHAMATGRQRRHYL